MVNKIKRGKRASAELTHRQHNKQQMYVFAYGLLRLYADFQCGWNGNGLDCVCARIHEIIKGGRCNTLDWRKNARSIQFGVDARKPITYTNIN